MASRRRLQLPGGCDVMLYQPRHAIAADIKRPAKDSAERAKKAAARKRRDEIGAKEAYGAPGRRAKKAARRR